MATQSGITTFACATGLTVAAARPRATIINHDGGVDGNSAGIGFVKEKKVGLIAQTNRGGDTAAGLAQIALRAAMRNKR
jgi:hypothetical protein